MHETDTQLLIEAKAFDLLKEYRKNNPGEPITMSMIENFELQAENEVHGPSW